MVFIGTVTRNVIKTPKQLYKHLLRTCQKLPTNAQPFYRHSIRQSFRQHEFEPDPDRVKQMIDKSILDAQWIVKKQEHIINTCCITLPRIFKLTMVDRVKWLPLKQSIHSITEEQFWVAVKIWKQNAHVVNRRVCSTVEIYQENLSEISYQYLEALIFNCPDLGKQALLKDTNLVQQVLSTIGMNKGDLSLRKVLPRSQEHFQECLELVLIDTSSKTATFINLTKASQSVLPQVPYRISYLSGCLSLEAQKQQKDLDTCHIWLSCQLLARLEKWAINAHVTSDSDTENFSQSLSLVNKEKYSTLYQHLKRKYGREMVKIWPECTDPAKFVYEDVAIAAYLLLLWEDQNLEKCSFVDLGCGNGLLVHILNSEGHLGTGLDVRERKVWSVYPSTTKLKVETVIPSEQTLFPETDWLIGNHSDELTPWIPVMAARSSPKTRYFVLPCCPYEFDGRKFNRRDTSLSQYNAYLRYVKKISEECGFETAVDRLRIPSTKRICLLGQQRTYNDNSWAVVNDRIREVIRQGCLNGTNDVTDNQWVANFKTREKEEIVRNCTRVDRNLQNTIVAVVVNKLLSDKCLVNSQREPNKTWNAGGSLLMGDAVKLVLVEQLKRLKSECGGLQTLLRNHHQIFQVEGGRVQLRRPQSLHDRASTSKRQRIGTKPCWFYTNHPDGCPLADDACCFTH